MKAILISILVCLSSAYAMTEGCTENCDYGMGPAVSPPPVTPVDVSSFPVNAFDTYSGILIDGLVLTPSQKAFLYDDLENSSPILLANVSPSGLPIVKLGMIRFDQNL
jgi:hypothetical protein